MRPPVPTIPAPMLPRGLPWVNAAALCMDQQAGRPVLVEFWDFLRVNSLRTLPYLKAWHARYAPHGLRVIGVHTGGFPPSQDREAVRAAVARLEIPYPVLVDDGQVWAEYGNQGWPARYLWNQRLALDYYHYGEGAYEETERAIQALLGVEREPVAPVRPEDAPGLLLPPQTEDQPGAYSGPYEAGGAWAVLDGHGTVTVNGRTLAVDGPGCRPLVEHPHHARGVLRFEVGAGVTCYATCFTPAPAAEQLAA